MFALRLLHGHPCRVAELDFFVDVVVTGAVLGVGLTDPPGAVARVLGDDFADDQGRTALRRDYGLVEFFWTRRSGSDPWHPAGFTVQAHRLASIEVTGTLADRYGPFGRRLPFGRLNAALERLGYRLEEVPRDGDPDYRYYWLAESRVSVIATATAWKGRLAAGDVWSISAPHPPEQYVAATRTSARRQAVKDGLAHLLRLDDDQRSGWLDRRQPAADAAANWYLYLLLVIDQQLGDQPGRRPDWVQLKVWLLRQAQARSVFTPAESAEKMAYLVLALRRAGVALATLPSADDVVRACLDAIPVGLDQVPLLDDRRDLHKLDLTQMRLSRQAKNLINAAQWHLDEIHDEQLAGQLRDWIAAKPRLV